MKPRIFISHSAKEPTSRDFLEELDQGLRGDHDVFVDRRRIELGVAGPDVA